MSAAPALRVVQGGPVDVVFEVEEGHPLIPDATYQAMCVGCDVKLVFKDLKTFLRFRISEGPHTGAVIWRAYRVGGKIVPGKGPGTGPRPRIKRGSKLFRMLCKVLELPANTKAHRVHARELVGKLCLVSTRTVTANHQQQAFCEAEKYSVVEDVLSIQAG